MTEGRISPWSSLCTKVLRARPEVELRGYMIISLSMTLFLGSLNLHPPADLLSSSMVAIV